MLPELSFELDAISLSLDEVCSYSDLMDMEVAFGDTLEMDLVINGTDSEFSDTSENALQNKVISNIITKAKDYTGFVDPDNVVVVYDISTRKVTLTGSVEFYWHGRRIAEIVDGWVSPAHTDSPGIYFLKYNGNGIEFDTDPWNFFCGQICYLQYKQGALGLDTMALRESHGMGDWNWHEGQHYAIGTMMRSGGDLSSYTLNSATATNRRPNVSTTYLKDEDLGSVLLALTTKKYTQRSLSGAGVRTFTLNQDDIIANNGTLPYYNQWNGSAWVQTLMSNNQYGAIFIVAIPTTADSNSQQYRYLWVQPQQVGTLAQIRALTPLNLTHGETSVLVSEFVFIGKIIIQVTGGSWRLYSVEKLTGSRALQVGSPSGSYLTVVNRDDSLVGNGTSTDPLGHNPADTTITPLKSVTDGGIITDTIWAWLGATASSVLSVVSNLITKVFNLYPQTDITFSGAIDLSKVDTHYSNYSQTGVLEITIAVNSIIGGSAEITITANGSAITVTGATQYGDTALDYTNGKINHLLFTKFTNGVYYSVRQLN